MTTPAEPSKRGGKRPGAGAKADIPTKIIALGVAILFDVGLAHARKMLRDGWTPETLVGVKRARKFRRLGASKRATENLEVLWEIYVTQRAKAGYKP